VVGYALELDIWKNMTLAMGMHFMKGEKYYYRVVRCTAYTHHTVVKWMLYEHSGIALWYIICAGPVFTLVA
jgi:hypothetical protein